MSAVVGPSLGKSTRCAGAVGKPARPDVPDARHWVDPSCCMGFHRLRTRGSRQKWRAGPRWRPPPRSRSPFLRSRPRRDLCPVADPPSYPVTEVTYPKRIRYERRDDHSRARTADHWQAADRFLLLGCDDLHAVPRYRAQSQRGAGSSGTPRTRRRACTHVLPDDSRQRSRHRARRHAVHSRHAPATWLTHRR